MAPQRRRWICAGGCWRWLRLRRCCKRCWTRSLDFCSSVFPACLYAESRGSGASAAGTGDPGAERRRRGGRPGLGLRQPGTGGAGPGAGRVCPSAAPGRRADPVSGGGLRGGAAGGRQLETLPGCRGRAGVWRHGACRHDGTGRPGLGHRSGKPDLSDLLCAGVFGGADAGGQSAGAAMYGGMFYAMSTFSPWPSSSFFCR